MLHKPRTLHYSLKEGLYAAVYEQLILLYAGTIGASVATYCLCERGEEVSGILIMCCFTKICSCFSCDTVSCTLEEKLREVDMLMVVVTGLDLWEQCVCVISWMLEKVTGGFVFYLLNILNANCCSGKISLWTKGRGRSAAFGSLLWPIMLCCVATDPTL